MAMMLGCGVLLGTVYDVCRTAAADFRLPRWTFPFIDGFYWAAATIFVFLALRYSNGAEVRIFVFIGLALGVLAYYKIFSSWVLRRVKEWIRFTKWLYRAGVTLFQWLVVKPIVLLYRFLLLILGILTSLTIFLFKVMLKLLYPVRWLGSALFHIPYVRKPILMFQGWWKRIKTKYNRDDKEE